MPLRLRLLDRIIEISQRADSGRLLSLLYRHFATEAQPEATLEVDPSGSPGKVARLWPPDETPRAGEPRIVPVGGEPLVEAHRILLEGTLGAARDLWVLHGGAVVAGGRALLVLGESWAGKTTLVMALLERGWALLSDDYAPVRAADLRVEPFPRALGVRTGGEAAPAPPLLSRRWIDPAAVAALATEPAPVGGIIVLEEPGPGAPPAALRPLLPAETFAHLLGALRNPETCPDPEGGLTALAAGVPAAALRRGPLEAMARAAASILG